MTDALDRATLVQFLRYGLSGATAVATLLVALVVLTEVAGAPPTLASVLAFGCALPVNYALQHRFVFNRNRQHRQFFARYVGVTLFTMALNAGLFWVLTAALGVFYVASQVITLGVIVPLNFVINRSFTFADLATERP
jgi:putative flippase GtrA